MRKIIHSFFYALLFTPVLAYVYMVYLKLPKSIIHLYTFFGLIIGIIFVLRRKKKYIPKFTWFLFFYAIYRFIWLQFADVNYHPLTFFYYSIYNFATFFLIIIIYNTRFSDKFIQNSIKIIKVTVILAVIASIMQVFNNRFLNAWQFDMNENIYLFRRTSIFGYVNPNALGLSYIPLAAVFIGYLLRLKHKSYILFTILIGITAFLSNTRYVMIDFVILTIQYLVFYKIKFKSVFRYVLLVFGAGLILYFTLAYLGYDFKEFYENRLFAEGDITETSRYKAIDNFLYFFPQKPVFGTGVHLTDEIKKASNLIGSSQIHVGYLSHLVSYGLVGSFLLFGFWFTLARYLYKNAKKTNYWGAFFAYLIFFFAQATLVYSSIFFTGLIFALIFDKYFQDKLVMSKFSIKNAI